MAESLKVLRRRVRSIKNIKQITRAMEMVSAAKLRRAQATLMAARPYAAKLQELLAHVASSSVIEEHPLFQPREGNRKTLVLFTADRGLAGSFNTNLIKKTEELLRGDPAAKWELVLVGRRGRDYFQRRSWPVARSWIGLVGQADDGLARELANYLLERFLRDETDQILLVYSSFISTVVYRPTVAQYLPLTPEALGIRLDEAGQAEARQEVDYILDPSADTVFDSLLPRYLSSKIYITLAEMATSEHSARMISMNNATKNCNDLQDSLQLRLNNARQAAITKELLDIVGGAEALKTG
ncbi:MAG TPA: ATP synthase F1 subunit gamma [Candidatus Sumerlaeota bacterium]|nr:ATP synthase F1 subunit gamma [Candidatus Sumerlaeota bacterium]